MLSAVVECSLSELELWMIILLFLFVLKKFYWATYTGCCYGTDTIFKPAPQLWREITNRVRSRVVAFVGECTLQLRYIKFRAGRGKPDLREYRLNKYVIKEWNDKIQPLGELTIRNQNIVFTPAIDWEVIASRLD